MFGDSKSHSKVPKIVVVGACNVDLISYVDQDLPLKVGETVRGKSFKKGFGGKGANQAVMAANCGAEVYMISKLGNDLYGDETINNFRKKKVDSSHIFREKSNNICSGLAPITVSTKTGANSIIIIPGANDTLTIKDIESCERVISKADILIVQLELQKDITLAAMRLAKKHNVRIIFNPAPAFNDLELDFFKLPYIIAPNEHELSLLTNHNIKDIETINEVEDAVVKLFKKDCENVIVTLGNNGALYMNNKKEKFHASIRLPHHFNSIISNFKVLDTSGAGDCFVGVLAYCIGKNISIERSISIANDAATISVARFGTQSSYPTKDELEQIYPDVFS